MTPAAAAGWLDGFVSKHMTAGVALPLTMLAANLMTPAAVAATIAASPPPATPAGRVVGAKRGASTLRATTVAAAPPPPPPPPPPLYTSGTGTVARGAQRSAPLPFTTSGGSGGGALAAPTPVTARRAAPASSRARPAAAIRLPLPVDTLSSGAAPARRVPLLSAVDRAMSERRR